MKTMIAGLCLVLAACGDASAPRTIAVDNASVGMTGVVLEPENKPEPFLIKDDKTGKMIDSSTVKDKKVPCDPWPKAPVPERCFFE